MFLLVAINWWPRLKRSIGLSAVKMREIYAGSAAVYVYQLTSYILKHLLIRFQLFIFRCFFLLGNWMWLLFAGCRFVMTLIHRYTNLQYTLSVCVYNWYVWSFIVLLYKYAKATLTRQLCVSTPLVNDALFACLHLLCSLCSSSLTTHRHKYTHTRIHTHFNMKRKNWIRQMPME